MAIPRVFISSTFYDLRQVREDIERFVRELGYEPVRNETGNIPYGKEERPEAYAYREVELCDIVISIIGGRFGTESQQDQPYSISQKELRTALDRGIQVFIFIDKNVLAEFSTYQLNKNNESTKYRYVDNVKIYQFIEEIHKLPRNNPIAPFETSADIVKYLRLQWAGLFQRFLENQQRMSEHKILEEMNTVAGTLRQLVDFLTEERRNKDDAIQSILLASHPAFRRFAEVTSTTYRVYFTNRPELYDWLAARGFKSISTANSDGSSYDEFSRLGEKGNTQTLKFVANIFDENGKLKIFTEDEWNDAWVWVEEVIDDDDIPF
ncbi:MAG TPA: DUF4062 domain-containing protein [Pyrinomonadaceae bacterium]|nr:DUF4062 domain-containing protein [Pyrinomonadaceae bacterium]